MRMKVIIDLVKWVPGLVWVKQRIFGQSRAHPPVSVMKPRERLRQFSEPRLRKSETKSEADGFFLCRIIGNDLVPRHRKGQARRNLAFILRHEEEFPECEKFYFVNRIVDPEEERKIIRILEDAGASFERIPFRREEYDKATWDIDGIPLEFAPHKLAFAELSPARQGRIISRLNRHRNNYVINNNGARNIALRMGRERAKWTMPWDGNCFLAPQAWEKIRGSIESNPEIPFRIVPMARITRNMDLLSEAFEPVAREEPQIVFSPDSRLQFDEEYFYGRRPKVELLWRLGVPGKWDEWLIEPWDLNCPPYSEEAGRFAEVAWVARLFSGEETLEASNKGRGLVDRGLARVTAVTSLFDKLDRDRFSSICDPSRPVFLDEARLINMPAALKTQISDKAYEALGRGPHAVTDKTSLPPSGNPHDYWHPAPYYWPHPLGLPGLPYVRRDGRRVPGTRLYEDLSDKYDRTRLQRMFDDTYVLAMATSAGLGNRFATHAAKLVRAWFLEPSSAMNPHLEYAQVRRGHNENRGSSSGIIEFKDLYYFLDAVRVLENGNFLTSEDSAGFRKWLGQYLDWLRSSTQGRKERASSNNHGTYYDLQVASIAAYLGDYLLVRDTLRDSRFRICEQFANDGSQPNELSRTTTAHYCCFNLQGWIHLANLAASVGEDIWNFESASGQGLRVALEWLLQYKGADWPHRQIDSFDADRFLPIWYAFCRQFGSAEDQGQAFLEVSDAKPIFHPHDGIRPFWQIGA